MNEFAFEEISGFIAELLETLSDLPEKAEKFAENTTQFVLSVQQFGEANGYITVNQKNALDNIFNGANKWQANRKW